MMAPTALMDIFVWAPSFAFFANFETCTGGGFISRQPKVCSSDYVKGIGRLFVSNAFFRQHSRIQTYSVGYHVH